MVFKGFPCRVVAFIRQVDRHSTVFPTLIFRAMYSMATGRPIQVRIYNHRAARPRANSISMITQGRNISETSIRLIQATFTKYFRGILGRNFYARSSMFRSQGLFRAVGRGIRDTFFFDRQRLTRTYPMFIAFQGRVHLFCRLSFRSRRSQLCQIRLVVHVFHNAFCL